MSEGHELAIEHRLAEANQKIDAYRKQVVELQDLLAVERAHTTELIRRLSADSARLNKIREVIAPWSPRASRKIREALK